MAKFLENCLSRNITGAKKPSVLVVIECRLMIPIPVVIIFRLSEECLDCIKLISVVFFISILCGIVEMFTDSAKFSFDYTFKLKLLVKLYKVLFCF